MNQIQRIALAAIGVFLLAPLLAAGNTASVGLSYLGNKDFPRGMRNNNPGNIRRSGNAWKGKLSTSSDSAFEQFISYAYGIRAMIRQLLTYQGRGLDTISEILYTWAPPADHNDTEGYISFVSNRSGFSPHQTLNLRNKATMSALVRAMAQMENYGGSEAKTAVTPEQFNQAWAIAEVGSIGAIYPTIPDFFECGDGTYSTATTARACRRHGGRRSTEPVPSGSSSKGSSLLNIQDVPLSKIHIDRNLFQGREKAFSKRSVENIIDDVANGRFVWENLDPITLWLSPDGKLFLLSGHSRHKAFEILADNGATVDGKRFDRIPAKIRSGNLSEAKRIALESNTLSTKENDVERASYYRKLRQDGIDEKALLTSVKKNEGRNWTNIYAYTFLSPSGASWAALRQFAEGEDQSATITKALAKWIGTARREFPELTNEHEAELYTWLFEHRGYGTGAGQVNTEREFVERLSVFIQKNTFFGTFDANKPLNIQAAQQKSPTELQYDRAIQEQTKAVRELETEIKSKIKTLSDRNAGRADVQRIISPMETALRNARLDLQNLLSKRGEVIEYSKNEATLFGYRCRSAVKKLW